MRHVVSSNKQKCYSYIFNKYTARPYVISRVQKIRFRNCTVVFFVVSEIEFFKPSKLKIAHINSYMSTHSHSQASSKTTIVKTTALSGVSLVWLYIRQLLYRYTHTYTLSFIFDLQPILVYIDPSPTSLNPFNRKRFRSVYGPEHPHTHTYTHKYTVRSLWAHTPLAD